MTRQHYDPELFYPLEGKARRSKFATVDLESKDGASEQAGFTRPFLAGLYDGTTYQGFTDTNPQYPVLTRHHQPGGCVDRLMHACLSPKRLGTTYYCHNGGAFDFLFLLPWLMRSLDRQRYALTLIPVGNSRLLSIHISVKGEKWGGWKFVDSLRTLPMGLDKAGTAFGLGGKNLGKLLDSKGNEFTLDTPSSDPAWLTYNQRDVVLLYDVIELAHDMVENEFGGEMGLTAPATSMKTFRRSFLPAPISRDTFTHDFIREGYVGGRTEKLEAEMWFGKYFDVNSSYPKAMTEALPMGGAEVWGEGEPPLEWRQKRIGFCRVLVHVPEDIELPPLPVKADGAYFPEGSGLDGKLLFPTGLLKGVWEWGELENALAEGCEIVQWFESVWYDAGPLAAEYVETLYRYRDKGHCYRCRGVIGSDYHCSKCQQTGYSEAFDAWAKILLNSWYGKTGQRPERMTYHLEGDPELGEGAMPLVSEDPECPIWVQQKEVDAPFILPQIAARVTALARVRLYRAARQAQKSVVRECWSCRSSVTYHGRRTGGPGPGARDSSPLSPRKASGTPSSGTERSGGWLLGRRVGGSGSHGDDACAALGIPTIGPTGSVCPCGGAVETRNGRVFYMDTDSILTDAHLETGKELGAMKDEVPRFSGFVHGKFYASKMYTLTVEPEWLKVDVRVRKAMMLRDGGYLGTLGLHAPPQSVDSASENEPGAAKGKKPKRPSEWASVRSKGLSSSLRTPENLQKLYDGAMVRLEWSASPENRYADGSLRPMPEDVELAGTLEDERLEQFGTLAGLIDRDENGDPILTEGADGYSHVTAVPFCRSPRMVKVPRRLHLEGAKRRLLPDGRSVPHRIDMTKDKPRWWTEREERRADLRRKRESRPASARVGKSGGKTARRRA